MSKIKKTNFGEVTSVAMSKDVECLVIKHNQCQAKVSLYGGQVLSWLPTGQAEVFWLSNSAEYKTGKAIRGGIPLCWPWFGDYKNGGNHGFVRNQVWQLDDVEISPSGVVIILSWQGQDIHPLWPSAAKLTQVLSFGASFEQTLKMENLSDSEVNYTGALHTYFSVSHPEKVTVDALNGVPFDCKLSGEKDCTDEISNMVGPIDRVYHSGAGIEIVDLGLKRVLKVSSNKTEQWVVWNPGSATAKKMSDIHENGEDEFFCAEAANTLWQVIPSKGCTAIAQKIEILPLA